jgi:predicted 3-demethylubiquinone-9 3-methyltransferase (glyoxalase superfamily)
MNGITPNLWFDTEAEEAAEFYCSIFPNSKITSVTHYTEGSPREAGMVMTVSWVLDGEEFTGINGGPNFPFTEAVSFHINCDDQAEVDYFWEKLTAAGGEEVQCGWLKDRFGVSWQVVPAGFEDVWSSGDPARAERAMKAMMGMKKLDLAALQAAADGA